MEERYKLSKWLFENFIYKLTHIKEITTTKKKHFGVEPRNLDGGGVFIYSDFKVQ